MTPFFIGNEIPRRGHSVPHNWGNQNPEKLNNISEATQLGMNSREIKHSRAPDLRSAAGFR